MGSDDKTEPWVTGVPLGTTDDVIQVLVGAGLIEDLGSRTSRQRWKKPLTFALAHGIRSGAISVEVLEILLEEARRILKGAKPMEAAQLKALVISTYTQDGFGKDQDLIKNPEIELGAGGMAVHNTDADNRSCSGEGGTQNE